MHYLINLFSGSSGEAEGKKATSGSDAKSTRPLTVISCDMKLSEETKPVRGRCIKKMEMGVLSEGEEAERYEEKVLKEVN